MTMPPRLQQLATDVKTYLAALTGLTTLLGAFTDVFKKLPELHSAFHTLPPEARWIAVSGLGLLTVILLFAAGRRRSVLRKPERFRVEADNPHYLVGREEHITALIEACERTPLVFLVGESGAGKSALVQAGVLPRLCGVVAPGRPPKRLLPLRMDASSMNWHTGVKDAVSSALYTLGAAECAQLGMAVPTPDMADPFGLLGTVSSYGARKLLLIFDQIDDYLVAHQQHLVSQQVVLTPSQLTEANPDWQRLARWLGENRLHLLLVCRRDTAVLLEALRLTDHPATYLLPRVEEHLLVPLLEALTKPVENSTEAIVDDPEYGWVQLKPRLLRDLAAGTHQVLPMQLVVALDALRHLRYLTPREYERHGGSRGLERLHIERHVRDVASGTGLSETSLLQGLLCLVHEDGAKTRRVDRQTWNATVLGAGAARTNLDIAVENLVRRRIVRRQCDGGQECLLLYHDY
jgi:hypothetical protein